MFTELNVTVSSWCFPQVGVCETILWREVYHVFPEIWGHVGKEQWVPASALELSEGPVEQPCQQGLQRPRREVSGEKKGAAPIPYPSLQPSEDVHDYLWGTCGSL